MLTCSPVNVMHAPLLLQPCAGSAHLVLSAAWRVQGCAVLAHTHALIHLACYSDVARCVLFASMLGWGAHQGNSQEIGESGKHGVQRGSQACAGFLFCLTNCWVTGQVQSACCVSSCQICKPLQLPRQIQTSFMLSRDSGLRQKT